MKEVVFKLFADCIPVKGARRSIIYDLGRNDYKLIPNILYEILSIYNGTSIQNIKNNYKGNDMFIDEYFNFLEKNEFIFYCDKTEANQFPALNLSWDYPAIISTAIINMYQECKINLEEAIKEMYLLGCKDFLLNYNRCSKLNELYTVMDFFSKFSIKSVDLILPYSQEIDNIELLTELCNNNITINRIIIYKAPFNNHIKTKSKVRGNIFYTKQQEIILKDTFSNNFIVNIPFFTEAQSHNVFFNRKIILSSLGFITNSIHNTNKKWEINKHNSIGAIVNRKDYTENWFINKDSILICRDCEFRYMCMDTRDPLKIADELYTCNSKNECSYNPYIAKWKGQEGWSSAEQRFSNND